MLQVNRASNTELLMLVSDFKRNSRRLKDIFSKIHGMPLMMMHRKMDTLPYNEGIHTLLASTTNCLISSTGFMDPMAILQRPITKGYIYIVR